MFVPRHIFMSVHVFGKSPLSSLFVRQLQHYDLRAKRASPMDSQLTIGKIYGECFVVNRFDLPKQSSIQK